MYRKIDRIRISNYPIYLFILDKDYQWMTKPLDERFWWKKIAAWSSSTFPNYS